MTRPDHGPGSPGGAPSRPFHRVLAVAAALLATAAPGLAQDAATCAEIAACRPGSPDGEYVLATPFGNLPLYCHDMAGTPREYLTLVNTGQFDNYGMYKAGGASPGTDLVTSFTRLRVDPSTLGVAIGDLTFSSSTGSVDHS